MDALQIRMFGKFQVQLNGQLQDGLCTGHALELLCYLLLHRSRPHHREVLAELLCPASTAMQARKCLSQALWQIQAACTARIPEVAAHLLSADPEWIQVNPEADIWLDVACFEQAHAAAQNLPGNAMDPRLAGELRAAVELYRGDFLEGLYQDWCVFERERLQNLYLAMLSKLAACCEAHHEYEAGIEYERRALGYDRAHESSHRRIMRLYYLAGDRVAALRQYEHCVEALRRDLDVAPSRRTEELYELIRADLSPPSAGEAKPREVADVPAGELGSCLRRLAAALAELLQLEDDLRHLQGPG